MSSVYTRRAKPSSAVPYADQILFGNKVLAAATFAQDEILMPNVPTGVLPAIMRVEIQGTTELDADADYVKWSLTNTSQDAVVSIDDTSCLACGHVVSCGANVSVQNHVQVYDFPAPLLCSMRKLYIQFMATEAQTVKYRIHWIPRPSSQSQRDNLTSSTQF